MFSGGLIMSDGGAYPSQASLPEMTGGGRSWYCGSTSQMSRAVGSRSTSSSRHGRCGKVGLTIPGSLIRHERRIGSRHPSMRRNRLAVRAQLPRDIGSDREELGRARLRPNTVVQRYRCAVLQEDCTGGVQSTFSSHRSNKAIPSDLLTFTVPSVLPLFARFADDGDGLALERAQDRSSLGRS